MAVKTIGIRTSLWNNNIKSILLLMILPVTLVGMVWTIMHILLEGQGDVTSASLSATAVVLTLVAIWFVIAFAFNKQITMKMANAKPVERKEYPELYNLVENLAIASGIKMPKLYIMETEALNAFASGLLVNDAIICVTRGLLDKLNKKELEAVLAHEMSHILHRDMRLLTIATLFVGVIAFIAEVALRSSRHVKVSSKDGKKSGAGILVIFAVAAIGYFIAILSKFAISRKREYMADAGSVTLTKDKEAMICALKKISGKSEIEEASSDLRFMLFDNTQAYLGLFSTHPSIEKRIKALEQY